LLSFIKKQNKTMNNIYKEEAEEEENHQGLFSRFRLVFDDDIESVA